MLNAIQSTINMQMCSIVNEKQCSTGELSNWSPCSKTLALEALNPISLPSESKYKCKTGIAQQWAGNSAGQGGGGYGGSSGGALALARWLRGAIQVRGKEEASFKWRSRRGGVEEVLDCQQYYLIYSNIIWASGQICNKRCTPTDHSHTQKPQGIYSLLSKNQTNLIRFQNVQN